MDLKIDLVNKITTDKFYLEAELGRLFNDQTMNYKQKIDEMARVLADIALTNAQLAGIDQYFTPPQPEQQAPQGQPVVQPAPQVVHQGQTHGE